MKWPLLKIPMKVSYIQLTSVLNAVREQLQKRGTKTIRGLGRAFRTIDSYDGNRKIDKEEFYWGLKDFGVDITK